MHGRGLQGGRCAANQGHCLLQIGEIVSRRLGVADLINSFMVGLPTMLAGLSGKAASISVLVSGL